MSKRKMTPLLARLYQLAIEDELPNPLGRAVALLNRHYNDGFCDYGSKRAALACLRAVSRAVARRWRSHWIGGGSVKCLGRSAYQESLRRRAAWARTSKVKNAYRREDRLRRRLDAIPVLGTGAPRLAPGWGLSTSAGADRS